YGFRAEVHTVFNSTSDAEVIAIDTDTRWRAAEEAARIVSDITRSVLVAKPDLIFKKTDSVLRGNVRTEIEAILDVTEQLKSLLIPANPSKKRVIRGGVYYIDKTPLHQTIFGRDPEFPRWTSRVAELLKKPNSSDRLLVPDVDSSDDV